MNKALNILKQYWGYNEFRFPQNEIVESVLIQKNTIALLPTGGGKSICFQVPALLMKGICLVISPMVSLIKDQVDSLQAKGIKAATIYAGTTQDDMITLFDNLKFGGYKFLYLSPERLSSNFIREKLKELTISFVAVDEAHCISEWGHDFRPSYRHISILKEIHPDIHYIALTATATNDVLKDIARNLSIEDATVFRKSFLRKELGYQIIHAEDKLARLLQIVQKYTGPAIIYVRSRKRTKEIATFLNARQIKASYYHGGLTSEERKDAFDSWMNENTRVMVATNAFGMGIDKSNVEIVIHLDLPHSIENYVQEAGRAGRNGEQSFSIVLQNTNDIHGLKTQFKAGIPTIKEIKAVYKYLVQYFRISLGELSIDWHAFKLAEFCQHYKLSLTKTNTILKILSNNGILELKNAAQTRSSLQFTIDSKQLISYKNRSGLLQKVVDTILRNYPGIYDHQVNINEYTIAKKAGITSNQVKEILNKLQIDQIVTYTEASSHDQLYFLVPREDDRTINSIAKNIRSYLRQQQEKIISLIDFIENDNVCRSTQLLTYFGESQSSNCDICDVCLQKRTFKNLDRAILNLLEVHPELSSLEIQTHINAKEKDILIHLRNLLAEDKIGINHINKYYRT